jgi:hypothetical protein
MPRLCILLTLSMSCFAAGQSTATAPASAPADRSTPQGTLKLLAAAMQDGDRAGMQALLTARTDQERKVVDAQIAQAVAFSSFRRAATSTFGEPQANEITGDFARAAADQLAKIDAAAVTIDGDAATVALGRETVYILRKLPEGWSVSIAGLLKDSRPDMIDQIVRDMRDQTSVVQETADEIAANKYKTTDEVAQAFQTKLLKLHLQRAAEAAATQPLEPLPATAPDER